MVTMVSQNELGRRFERGDTSGTASNVSIRETADTTQLIGYGWAVYAEREKETGRITYFNGWYGYSQSTSCQISKMGLRSMADEMKETDPSI